MEAQTTINAPQPPDNVNKSTRKTDRKRAWAIITLAVIVLLGIMLGALFHICDQLVSDLSDGYLYSDPSSLPVNQVGVVLGTSRYTSDGQPNGHYLRRLEAAATLIRMSKIHYILVSGDNATPYYDEPSRMKADLIAIGVPADRIYRDYAGFRTLDSVIRANKVFSLTQFTLISQQYQNERAIFIAQKHDIQAIAFNAHGNILATDYSNRIREILARLLAVLEVLLLYTQPQILGESIIIGETPPT